MYFKITDRDGAKFEFFTAVAKKLFNMLIFDKNAINANEGVGW